MGMPQGLQDGHAHINEDKSLEKPYTGIVVDNRDPLMLARIKVKVEGKLEADNPGQLPWAVPNSAYGLGGRSDCGSLIIPEINTTVNVTFPLGDTEHPTYIGKEYDPVNNSPALLFGEDYPDVYGFVDSVIEWLRINKKRKTIEFFRQLGELIRLDKEGNLIVNIPGNLKVNIGKDILVNVLGNIQAKAVSNIDITAAQSATSVSGSFNITAGGTINETASGDVNIKGANYKVSASSTANIGATSASICGMSVGDGNLKANELMATSLLATTVHASLVKSTTGQTTGAPTIINPTAPSSAGEATGASTAKITSMISEINAKIAELTSLATQLESLRDSIKLQLGANALVLGGSDE